MMEDKSVINIKVDVEYPLKTIREFLLKARLDGAK